MVYTVFINKKGPHRNAARLPKLTAYEKKVALLLAGVFCFVSFIIFFMI
ncbi:MAG: hypothetical protein JWM28_3105 [Chitinophagaceae bacterium]|nr:hypothetical protein [Chitinophagaceae bacterium]